MTTKKTHTRVHFHDPKNPMMAERPSACGTRGKVVKVTAERKKVTCANCKHAVGIR